MCVPPWELARQPSTWINYALSAEKAEAEGERIACELQQQRKEVGGE